jgi:hypothetical protein
MMRTMYRLDKSKIFIALLVLAVIAVGLTYVVYAKNINAAATNNTTTSTAQNSSAGNCVCICEKDSKHVKNKNVNEHKEERGAGHLYNLTTLEGVVVNKSVHPFSLTLSVNNVNYTMIFMRFYVRESDGALVYGPWIFNNVHVGDTVTVKTVVVANKTVAPILSITVGGQNYTTPYLYSFLLRH